MDLYNFNINLTLNYYILFQFFMKTMQLLIVGVLFGLLISCGGGHKADSEKSKALMATAWGYDMNASIKTGTDQLKDATGISADIKLGGDVGAIADAFTARQIQFGFDSKDKSKLVFEETSGKGLLASKKSGYWHWSNKEETELELEYADDQKTKKKYKVVKLSGDTLILKPEDGKSGQEVYIPASKLQASNSSQQEKPRELTEEEKTPGYFPMDFPGSKITAKEGEKVFAISRRDLENWFRRGTEKGSVSMYLLTIKNPITDKASYIQYSSSDTGMVPNQVIIPIGTGNKAKKGDVVLCAWGPGSVNHGIVVDAANPAEPKIKYLDFDANSSMGQEVSSLKANEFIVLTQPFQSGSYVVIKGESRPPIEMVIKTTGDKVLTQSWGGSLKVRSRKDCVPCPVKPMVKPGDEVYAPWVGTMDKAKVKSVDKDNGRVIVNFANMSTDYAIPFGKIVNKL